MGRVGQWAELTSFPHHRGIDIMSSKDFLKLLNSFLGSAKQICVKLLKPIQLYLLFMLKSASFVFLVFQAQVGKQFILPPYDVVVRSVAKYVRDLVDISDLQAIMVQVFRSPETTEADFLHRLQRSIQHYSNDSSDEGKHCLSRTAKLPN